MPRKFLDLAAHQRLRPKPLKAVVSPFVTPSFPDRSISLGFPRFRGRPLEADRSGLAFRAQDGIIWVAPRLGRLILGMEPA
jgi:hypothetical protein